MAQLQDLPTEILIQVLRYVRHEDFRTFLLSQATARRFRNIVQDMITSVSQPITSFSGSTIRQRLQENPSLNPLLQHRFAPLFDTSNAFTGEEHATNIYYYLSLEGDVTLPFRRLPWAQRSETEREVYLRPEASWRRLPLLAGEIPITQLEVIKNYTTETGDTVKYLQVELPTPPGPGLTMGLFYDLLLGGQATYGWDTGSWELHLGTRLRNVELLFEYECYIFNDGELVDRDAPNCAVLHVLGGSGCSQEFAGVDWEMCWGPQIPGEKPPKCLPWQGPLNQIGNESEDDDENNEDGEDAE